jgi:putative tricarboxylic transport membrane protein
MYEAFLSSLDLVFTPSALGFMLIGVVVGLIVGLLPGLGGPVGLAVLLPFTFDMAAIDAFAFLLGMLSVTSTASDITAVLFGVPGDSVSAALVVDGHPMAKKGQVGLALGASLSSSLLGALIGAVALGLALPFLRPLVLVFGSPELFMLTLLGVTFVAALSEGAVLKGLISGGIGLVVSFVGMDAQTGVVRYSFGQLALWDGVGLVAVAVGLFAVPELVDLAVSGRSIGESGGEVEADSDRQGVSPAGSGESSPGATGAVPVATAQPAARTEVVETDHGDFRGVVRGMKATLEHWALMVRCSLIGVFVGIMPGLGGSVAQWVSYAHAVQSSPNQHEFGTGRIEGVIGPGAANNSKEGGSLIPTIAFGVPGSVTMAILLGAFLIQGLTPGPSMVGDNLDLTMSFIWFIAIANVVAVGLCLLAIKPIAMTTKIRGTLLIPSIALLVLVGAFAEKNAMIDVWIVLVFGLLGLVMHVLGWPRPPLLLGLVLGGLAENYLFISVNRYGNSWLGRPIVIVIGLVAVAAILYPVLRGRRTRRATKEQL